DEDAEADQVVPGAHGGGKGGAVEGIDRVPGAGRRQRQQQAVGEAAPPGRGGDGQEVEDAEGQLGARAVVEQGDAADQGLPERPAAEEYAVPSTEYAVPSGSLPLKCGAGRARLRPSRLGGSRALPHRSAAIDY